MHSSSEIRINPGAASRIFNESFSGIFTFLKVTVHVPIDLISPRHGLARRPEKKKLAFRSSNNAGNEKALSTKLLKLRSRAISNLVITQTVVNCREEAHRRDGVP